MHSNFNIARCNLCCKTKYVLTFRVALQIGMTEQLCLVCIIKM